MFPTCARKSASPLAYVKRIQVFPFTPTADTPNCSCTLCVFQNVLEHLFVYSAHIRPQCRHLHTHTFASPTGGCHVSVFITLHDFRAPPAAPPAGRECPVEQCARTVGLCPPRACASSRKCVLSSINYGHLTRATRALSARATRAMNDCRQSAPRNQPPEIE